MQYHYAIPMILLTISCSAAPSNPPKAQSPGLHSPAPANARITPLRDQEAPTPNPETKAPHNSNAGQGGGVRVEASFTVGSYCPSMMVHIKGEYCPKIEEHCIKWLDDPNRPGARCEHYAPSTCLTSKVQMEYCIDREELHDETGMPYGDLSWTSAKAMCEEQGARLCNEAEWNFACTGEEMQPYPYGYDYSLTTCNIYRKPMLCDGKICEHRAKISEFSQCVSSMGIHDMVGNVDEWIEVPAYQVPTDPGVSMRSGLKGGHFVGGRNRCLPITKGHDEQFRNPPTVGTRCCKSL